MGGYLGSRELSKLLKNGTIRSGSPIKDRVQPASYEPCIGNECYVLTAHSIPRPSNDETVLRALREQVPGRRREKKTFDALEMRVGHSYLFPLQDSVVLRDGMRIDASPKSSWGRTFPHIRLISDYNPTFDEIAWYDRPTKEAKLWLLVQPQKFNLIARPGYTMNQIRIARGRPMPLHPNEIMALHKRKPLSYCFQDGKMVLIKPRITDTLEMTLDARGASTSGIIGFRALDNPDPLDVQDIGANDVFKYFDPVKSTRDRFVFDPGEFYIFSSAECVAIAEMYNAILPPHSPMGLRGETHFAGFFDPGFTGDGTFEYYCQERASVALPHGTPISKVLLYRNTKPIVPYGSGIGSHYSMQSGPRMSKCFAQPDCEEAAGMLAKMNYPVLVQEKEKLLRLHGD